MYKGQTVCIFLRHGKIENIFERAKNIFKITQGTRNTTREYILEQIYI